MSHLTGTAYPAEERRVILTVLFLGQILSSETKTGTAWDIARKKVFEAAEKHLSTSRCEEMAKQAEICCYLSPTESLCLAGRNRGAGVVTSNAFPTVLSCAHREAISCPLQIQDFHRQQGAGEFCRYRLHARGLGFKAYFCVCLCSSLSNF